jgi:hypothetical protein
MGRNHQTQRRTDSHGEPGVAFVPVSIRDAGPIGQLEVALGNACVVRLTGIVDPRLLRVAIRAAGRLQGPEQGAD